MMEMFILLFRREDHMFNLKQIGFCSILFLLIACSDSTYNRGGRGVYRSPYGTPVGGIAGAPAGVAVLSSNASANVSRMQMQIFGTGGQSALDYNGTAQFRGTMEFPGNYGSNYTNYQNPHYSSSYTSYSPQQQCSGPVQFNCQGTLSNQGKFNCQTTPAFGGGIYTIKGILEAGRTTAENYEIASVVVLGPCTLPRP